MNINDFMKVKIPTQPVQSSFLANPNPVKINVKNPVPVGYLVVSKDKETGGGVKLALYNKLPNKFQQFFIKFFFGWWIEKEEQV